MLGKILILVASMRVGFAKILFPGNTYERVKFFMSY